MSGAGGAGGPGRCGGAPNPESTNSTAIIMRQGAAHKGIATKRQRVLRALLAGPVTSFQLEREPVFEHVASATISELRKAGLGIVTEMVDVRGYAGQGARIARYHLEEGSRELAFRLAYTCPR